MIKDNQRIFNRLHVVIDAMVIALSYLFAWFLKFKSGLLDYEMGLSPQVYFGALYFIVPGYLLLYHQFDLYGSKRASGRKRELFNIIRSNTVGLVAFIVVLYLINNPDFSRQMILIFWGVNIVAETGVRNVIRYALRFIRRRGNNLTLSIVSKYKTAPHLVEMCGAVFLLFCC